MVAQKIINREYAAAASVREVMSANLRLRNSALEAAKFGAQRGYSNPQTLQWTFAIFVAALLSFVIYVRPDSTIWLRSHYYVFVIFFIAGVIMAELNAGGFACMCMFYIVAVLIGESLFSPEAVLTFFSVLLVMKMPTLLFDMSAERKFALLSYLGLTVSMFVVTSVAILPHYAGVYEPAAAATMVSFFIFYAKVALGRF